MRRQGQLAPRGEEDGGHVLVQLLLLQASALALHVLVLQEARPLGVQGAGRQGGSGWSGGTSMHEQGYA